MFDNSYYTVYFFVLPFRNPSCTDAKNYLSLLEALTTSVCMVETTKISKWITIGTIDQTVLRRLKFYWFLWYFFFLLLLRFFLSFFWCLFFIFFFCCCCFWCFFFFWCSFFFWCFFWCFFLCFFFWCFFFFFFFWCFSLFFVICLSSSIWNWCGDYNYC